MVLSSIRDMRMGIQNSNICFSQTNNVLNLLVNGEVNSKEKIK